jgi:hypothetical protein
MYAHAFIHVQKLVARCCDAHSNVATKEYRIVLVQHLYRHVYIEYVCSIHMCYKTYEACLPHTHTIVLSSCLPCVVVAVHVRWSTSPFWNTTIPDGGPPIGGESLILTNLIYNNTLYIYQYALTTALRVYISVYTCSVFIPAQHINTTCAHTHAHTIVVLTHTCSYIYSNLNTYVQTYSLDDRGCAEWQISSARAC